MNELISIEYKTKGHRFLSINELPKEVIESDAERLLSELKADPIMSSKGMIGVNTLWLKKHSINLEAFEQFTKCYAAWLEYYMRVNASDYMGKYELTLNNMKWAIVNKTFNKDSESFKATCKALGIKHTYKAIYAFLGMV